MATFFLPKNRKSLYHRVTIPQNLRPYFDGRSEVWRSLKTLNKDEAAARSAQWEGQGRQLFVTLKRQGDQMDKAQIEALVERWLESELDESEDARALAGHFTNDYLDGVQLVLSNQFNDVNGALLSNDFRIIEREAHELIKAAGLPALDHDGVDFGRLCRRLLRAKQDFLRLEADRWNGVYNNHRPIPTPYPPHYSSATPGTGKSSPVLSKVINKFMNENPRAKRMIEPTKAEFTKFVAVVGDKPIHLLTKDDGRRYKESLLTDRKLALATVSKHISTLTVMWKWAEAQGFVGDNGLNPFKGLMPNKKAIRRELKIRKAFTDEQLVTVLGSPDFLAQRERRPERYWLVLLCLFEVCRREEAGQLTLADIQERDDVPFIRITDEGPDQALKNAGSRRRVPIHSSLIELGFLDYVKTIKASRHERLFPQLRQGPKGFADPVGKWFGRSMHKCGLTDPLLVLHSLRHTGITKLHAAGCPANVVLLLVGHVEGNVHEGYVHKEALPMSLLKDGLERLRYDEAVQALEKEV